MVVVNNSKDKQTFKVDRFKENLEKYTKGIDVLSGNSFDCTKEITIEGKSSLILELK